VIAPTTKIEWGLLWLFSQRTTVLVPLRSVLFSKLWDLWVGYRLFSLSKP